ncbi:hypothetical protein [Xenorhabdus entomophaga]|uniref:hypothetical protein n=1 Tax=Xenorhabdus entomophaga TaxID=3136257 RepID=UPI0030F3D58C
MCTSIAKNLHGSVSKSGYYYAKFYTTPTKVIFGKGQIAQLSNEIPKDANGIVEHQDITLDVSKRIYEASI